MAVRHIAALALLTLTAAASADDVTPARVAWTRAALARVPVSKFDNTPERLDLRARQQEEFAREIARVSSKAPLSPKVWASLLVAQGSIESNFDSAVVQGQCASFQCDAHLVKGTVVFKAKGAFQQQNVSYVADLWPTAETSIPAQVEMADRTLRRSLTRCKAFASFPAHVFRAYGGARSCSWPAPREAERIATYLRALSTPNPKAEQ